MRLARRAAAFFLQIGCYLGSAETLPTVTSPHIFVGEYDPNVTNHETLYGNLGSLAGGSYHNFRAIRDSSGDYDFYVDGSLIFVSYRAHPRMSPAFNGEIDNSCTTMYARAERNPAPPYGTLYGHSASKGWYLFADADFAPSGFQSFQLGGAGSDLATQR